MGVSFVGNFGNDKIMWVIDIYAPSLVRELE